MRAIPSACALVLSLSVLLVAGCGGPGERIDAVEALPGTSGQARPVDEMPPRPGSGDSELTRGSGEEPGAILEFGLFGPVLPAGEGEVYEIDCRFEDDPYETCL